MTSLRRCRRQWRMKNDGLFRAAICLLVVILAVVLPQPCRGQDEAESEADDVVVKVNRFVLRLSPANSVFALDEKVTVLWTVENHIRVFLEDKYADSLETFFVGAGITGLSVMPSNDQPYETLKFLGGAVTFDSSSTVVPAPGQMKRLIQECLTQGDLTDTLKGYFSHLESVEYEALAVGNRGFGNEEDNNEEDTTAAEESSNNDNSDTGAESEYTKPPLKVSSVDNTDGEQVDNPDGNNQDSDTNGDSNRDFIKSDGLQQAAQQGGSSPGGTTIGLSAVAGAILFLLVGFLVQSRRKRMDFWRERSNQDGDYHSRSLEDSIHKEKPSSSSKNNKSNNLTLEEENEPALRLPRIWGVVASPRMDAATCLASDASPSEGGDSVHDILTCTSVGIGSTIRNVESFEHQKRLVDTLKKEMMMSNAEIHPYLQDPHLDSTEPCALSPTDLSAAALGNTRPPQSVAAWSAPSESSVSASDIASGTSGSGYDSPTSSPALLQRSIFGALQLSSSSSRQRRSPPLHARSPYEPDVAEL